jgi:ATP-dependent DNA ligase
VGCRCGALRLKKNPKDKSLRWTDKRSPKGRAVEPEFIAPELATPDDEVPEGRSWLHEVKHDGYRILARKTRDEVKIKCGKRAEFVIGGFHRQGLAPARHLREWRAHLCRKVGTGFDEATLKTLSKRFKPLERKTSPFKEVSRPRGGTACGSIQSSSPKSPNGDGDWPATRKTKTGHPVH